MPAGEVPREPDRSFTVEEIHADRARLVAAAMGHEGDLVSTRMARGCRCFGVFAAGELAGYGWLSTDPEWIGELELTITPRRGEGYIWNCVTLPAHRRRGVFRTLISGIAAAARDGGLRRVWIGSVAIPAERAVGPSGFEPALHFSTFKLAGLLWASARPSAGAGATLASDALSVLQAGGQPLRPGASLRLSSPRRH